MKAIAERNWKAAYQEYWGLPEDEKQHLQGWGMHNELLTGLPVV